MPAVSSFVPESGLTPFEGQEVITTSVAVTNAGDGLSKSLSVDPQEFQMGDTVFITLRCDVTKVSYQPVKGAEDKLDRVHTFRATDATIVDADLVSDHINAQRDRILRSREEAAGIQRLQLEAADDDEA